ncbi:hypothetical protein ACI3L1_19510, partial [Deinococcus sp. SM5_A1]|uniref:hypothetical protein n=1 Tax=Deinococcus sp. SM5_A1 TaxID=3379094 RepID=UPI00385D0D43
CGLHTHRMRSQRMIPLGTTDPHNWLGRHGATGKNWIVKVDDQDVTHKVLQLAIKDIESVIIAARKHIDKMTL